MYFQFVLAIDLDDLNDQTRPHLNNVLLYFNSIVKTALR